MKPIKRYILWGAAAVAAAVLIIGAGVVFVLPAFLESSVIQRLAAANGFEANEVRIRRIGLTGADVGPIRIEDADRRSIDITAVQIDYTLWGLLRKRIRGIVISGLRLELPIALAAKPDGVSPPRKPREAVPKGEAPDILASLRWPVRMDYLKIVQSEIVLIHMTQRITIALDAALDTAAMPGGPLKSLLRISSSGIALTLNVDVDPSTGRTMLKLLGQGLDLRRLSTLFPRMPLPLTAGRMDVTGSSVVRLDPPGIEQLSINARLLQTRIGTARTVIENVPDSDGGAVPIEIAIDRAGPMRYRWRCAPFHVSASVAMRVDMLEGQWIMGESGWELTVGGSARSSAQVLPPEWILDDPLAMQWSATIRPAADERLAVQAQARMTSPAAATIADTIHLRQPDLTAVVDAILDAETMEAKWEISGTQSRISLADGIARIGRFALTGDLAIEDLSAAPVYRVNAKSTLAQVQAEMDSIRMMLPAIDIQATAQSGGDRRRQLDGRVTIRPGRIQVKQPRLVLDQASLQLPFQWPPTEKQTTGPLQIGRILFDDRPMGRIDGRIGQHGRSLSLTMDHTSKLFPGLHVLIDGALNRSGGTLAFTVPAYTLPSDMEIDRFWPRAANMVLGGRLEASGRLKTDRATLSGSAQVSFDEGYLKDTSQKLDLEGIRMEVHFDNLPGMDSAPRQTLAVRRVRIGNLDAEDLRIDFQIERPQTLFIEKAAIQWCNGTVNTGALRITPGRDDYELTLFCDRLDLAMVLKQLGAAEASGEGAVNGRIPLHWADGGLTFDKGFLYSTPGKSGTIRLGGTRRLLSGLPPGTPQHTQLDIATEALKDYTYKWARLYLESEDRDLLLKLQFDGKPNHLLPFAYDTEMGSFKRVTGEGQADFTGISIDLNFRSPLNDILQYKKLFSPKRK